MLSDRQAANIDMLQVSSIAVDDNWFIQQVSSAETFFHFTRIPGQYDQEY